MTTVSVIIPTLNESKGITKVIDEIPDGMLRDRGYHVEILVVDGGSSDGTRSAADVDGVDVLEDGGGKASAVRKGLRECGGDYVFLIDGDGSYPAGKMVEMLDELEKGRGMVLGSRFLGKIQHGAMSGVNKFGNRVLTWMANGLYGTDVSDLCTGLRGIDRSRLNGRDIPGKGFEVEAGIHAVMGGDVVEVPIEYSKRVGSSKLRVWDGVKIAKRLVVERFKK